MMRQVVQMALAIDDDVVRQPVQHRDYDFLERPNFLKANDHDNPTD